MSILFENVSKSFDKTVLDNVTVKLEKGKITALLGTSGKGKTTVLRLIAGLEKADKGTVKVHGKVGYLFQEHRLLPTVSAFENVRLVSESDEAAKKALRLCKADMLADKKADEMSGGERQRVALARLVAFDANIWLMDEPFSALDGSTKEEILENLLPLMREKTVILVTHSEAEASICDNIINL